MTVSQLLIIAMVFVCSVAFMATGIEVQTSMPDLTEFDRICNMYFEKTLKTGDFTASDRLALKTALEGRGYTITTMPGVIDASWGDSVNFDVVGVYTMEFSDGEGGQNDQSFDVSYSNSTKMAHVLEE